MQYVHVHVVLETIKQHLTILMLKQYSTGNIFKSNAKTLEHPGHCSVLGTGHYPRTRVRGGVGGPYSDFIRLSGMNLRR